MPPTPHLRLLRAQTRHLAAVLRSDGGRRDLKRALRGGRGDGVALFGELAEQAAVADQLRRWQPRMAIAIGKTAGQWLHDVEMTESSGPLLRVVDELRSVDDRTALDTLLEVIARQRRPLARWAIAANLPCWTGSWAPDATVQWLGASSPHWQEGCHGCGARRTCEGPPSDVQVSALPAPLSNQFDAIEGAEEGRGGVTVEIGGRQRSFRVDDTAIGAAIARLALARGQLYLDTSDVARLDDFAAQAQPLELGDDGRWRPRRGDPFAAEERALLKLLAELQGTVVDIGAGPVRYIEQLQRSVQQGALRYIAVEPDLCHLGSVAAQWPGSQLVQGVGEALPLQDASADAAMMLRSYNHLRDPGRAIDEAARVVRPGGTLLVVDNVVFGLCRSAEQVQRARAIDVAQTPFEHYRNANGDEAAEAIAQSSAWQVTRCEPVTPKTANQWLVVARRTSR